MLPPNLEENRRRCKLKINVSGYDDMIIYRNQAFWKNLEGNELITQHVELAAGDKACDRAAAETDV